MIKRLQTQIDYWRGSAEKSFKAAQILFDNRHYDSCLFFCHLALEKLLKGLTVVATSKEAPYIHDLVKLANLANLELKKETIKELRIITTFNIAGRYQEEKLAFYKRCTKNYTTKYLNASKILFSWLKKKYPKK